MDCENDERMDVDGGACGVRVGDQYFAGILEGVEGGMLVVEHERRSFKSSSKEQK